MQPQREKQSDVVVAFPTERARRRAVPAPESVAAVSALHRRSVVVPLRCGHVAQRAAVLVKVRRLHAEIEALTTVGQQRNKARPTRLAARVANPSVEQESRDDSPTPGATTEQVEPTNDHHRHGL